MKKTSYPKTKRFANSKMRITEKLDGSNLWIFMLNWELIIAQRNYIFRLSELSRNNYKWLAWRLENNLADLDLYEWSWVFGERIWMWKIKYGESLDKRFYIFAKARIDEEYEISHLQYSDINYAFNDAIIPDCVWVVPTVAEVENVNIEYLDNLYDEYKAKVQRPVEWFVIFSNWGITKYVRHKNWIETPHKK